MAAVADFFAKKQAKSGGKFKPFDASQANLGGADKAAPAPPPTATAMTTPTVDVAAEYHLQFEQDRFASYSYLIDVPAGTTMNNDEAKEFFEVEKCRIDDRDEVITVSFESADDTDRAYSKQKRLFKGVPINMTKTPYPKIDIFLVPTKDSLQKLVNVFGVTELYREHYLDKGYLSADAPTSPGLIDMHPSFLHVSVGQAHVNSEEKLEALLEGITAELSASRLRLTFTSTLWPTPSQSSGRIMHLCRASKSNKFNRIRALVDARTGLHPAHITINKYKTTSELPTRPPDMTSFALFFDCVVAARPGHGVDRTKVRVLGAPHFVMTTEAASAANGLSGYESEEQ